MTQLDRVLELSNLRLAFSALGLAGELREEVASDLGFLRVVARALAGPGRRRGPSTAGLFPPFARREHPGLAGRRIGVVASGGAGAMASLIGVKRAFEEAGLEAAALSACSGATLFATLWASGLSAEEMAGFWLGLEDRDYIDPDWSALGRALAHRFRGWGGLLRGEAIERTFARRLRDRELGQTAIPVSAVVWNIDENRVEYIGTRQTPELTVARAARVAISLPILVEPVELRGHQYGDGGIVDIFPARPLLEEPEPLDVILGVNCYYAEDFAGEDATGWLGRRYSVLRAAGQLRWSGHLELARTQARLCGDRLVMIHPVPYDEVRGARFYRSFLDRSSWPRFIRQGYQAARAALERWPQRPRWTTVTARRIEPLAPVDAAWLRMERPDNPMTVTSALVFDRPLEHGRLVDVAARAADTHERFRQRIVERTPGHPCWDLVPRVDVESHVERVRLPALGDDAALRSLIGRLVSQPLDRSRPLWRIWHVEGYRGGSFVVVQLHHSMGDGAALVRLLVSLAAPAEAGPASHPHAHGHMLRPAELPRHPAATLQALGHLLALPRDPATSLRGELGTDKRVAWSEAISLAWLHALGQHLGATANDVLLACLASALGQLLAERGEPLAGRILHALVPVDLRDAEPEVRLGNQFGLVFAPLPLEPAAPTDRLLRMAAAMAKLKRSPEAALGLWLLGALGGMAPPALYDRVIHYFGKKATLVVTNVPGPAQRLVLAGQPIRSLLVWVPQSARLGLGVSLLSYAGEARVGVTSDVGICPDPERIVAALHHELERLAPAVAA